MSITPLTERYVHEVVRRLPTDQREDVAQELRGTIADTVEARGDSQADGTTITDTTEVERSVLTEMGDPVHLAARYTDRPLGLIGPTVYPTYIRLLTVLLTGVLPVVALALMGLAVLEGSPLPDVLLTGAGTVVVVGAQMIAWPTLVFALVERGRATPRTRPWNPDDLPSAEDTRTARRSGVGACVAATGSALFLGAIVWQHIARPYPADRQSVPVLESALWSGWIWPILVGLALLVVLHLVRAVAVRWTLAHALWYTAAQVCFALPLALVLHRREIFDPVFLDHFNQGWTTPDAFYTGLALLVLVVAASATFSGFREART